MFGIDVPRSTAPHGALACRAEAVSPVPPDPLAGARHLIICLFGSLGTGQKLGGPPDGELSAYLQFPLLVFFCPSLLKRTRMRLDLVAKTLEGWPRLSPAQRDRFSKRVSRRRCGLTGESFAVGPWAGQDRATCRSG
jgi:hypothetical protein